MHAVGRDCGTRLKRRLGPFAIALVWAACVMACPPDAAAQSTVTVSSTGSPAESGQSPVTFTITRTSPAILPLLVQCSFSGTAAIGVDYSSSASCPLTIPLLEASTTITVTPVNDSLPEGNETITFTLDPGGGYFVGAPSSITVNLLDDDLPTVTVSATDATAAEAGSNSGTFTIQRNGPISNALAVSCALTGTASRPEDYSTSPSTACSGTVTIPANASSAVVTITPVNDNIGEETETVILTLAGGAGYAVGASSFATVNITDNDPSMVSVIPTDSSANEEGQDAGAITIQRTAPTSAALTVNCSLTGTANRNTDYTTTPGSACSGNVTIPAGASSITVAISPVDDATVESLETVILTISSGSGYVLGTPVSGTVNITDNDFPAVLSLVGGATLPSAVSPNQQLRFTIGVPASAPTSSSTVNGTLTATFTPAPQSVQDPNMLFQNISTSVNFRIPANSRQGVFLDNAGQPFTGGPTGSVGFQPGTNAGTIVLTSSIAGVVSTSTTMVEALRPTITRVVAQRTSSGMTVSVSGISTPRNMVSATFIFSGPGLASQSVTVNGVAGAFTTYYSRRDAAALNGGSAFLMTQTFTVADGTPDQFTSVTVTLTNSVDTSEAVTLQY